MSPTGSLTVAPKKKPAAELSVKINAEAYRLAKVAAAWVGCGISEYLSRAALEMAARDIDEMRKSMDRSNPLGKPSEDDD